MMAAQQASKEAGRKASAGASALGGFVRENNWSVRGLSFIGSLAMIVLSVLKILNFFGVLTDFFGYVINVYSFIFAFAMLMIEAKDDWPLVEVCLLLWKGACIFSVGRGRERGSLATLGFCEQTWAAVCLRYS